MRRTGPLWLLGLVALAALARPAFRLSPIPLPKPTVAQLPTDLAEDPPPLASLPEPAAPAAPASPPPEAAEPATDPESWRRSPVLRSLLWLTRHQNEDGSWGDGPVTVEGHTLGKAGVTGLALLAYLGQGYSHLSKDEYDGVSLGPTIRRGLAWLLRDQLEDGRFASICDGGFDQALTTYALGEYYGMTATRIAKEPLEKAIQALSVMQGSDGSWGGPAATVWALKALAAAEFNEVPVSAEVRDRALRYTAGTSHPGNVLTRILFTRDRASVQIAAAALAAAPPPAEDLAGWYHSSGSLLLCDGAEGARWQSWRAGLKTAILGQQGADGTWFGGTLSNTVARSSLALQALETLHR